MAQQRGLTLVMGWLFVLLFNSPVGCRWVSEYSGGCWNTSEVEPFNCTSDDTTSLYKKVKNALWCTEIRPVQQPWDVLNVKLGLTIAGIYDVNEKDQVIILSIVTTLDWEVPFLKWDNATCGTNKISYPKSELWLPDIQIEEFVDEDRSTDLPYVQLNYTGGVHLVQRKKVFATCDMDIYRFPFDVHTCSLTFQSYMLEEDEMSLTSKSREFIQRSSVTSDSGWILEEVTQVNNTFNLTTKRYFSSVRYNFTIKREASLYVVNLLVPSCFLSLLDMFSFFLPPHNVDRSAFKMTLILGYTVFLLITNDILPASGSKTPLINVFFSLSLALMVASLLETMFIVNVSNNANHYPRIPRWLHVLVLNYLARLLFMSPKPLGVPVEVILNPHAKVTPDTSGEAMVPADTGEKDEMECAAVVDELKKVAREVLTIRFQIEEHLRPNQGNNDWKMIANVIDRLLFLFYVLFVVASYITIIAIWASSTVRHSK
ncbi:5-hydroxytryptamine receptor 3A [Ictalurus punctatus]|uniref:5-hydroxytryptamine receptor 3A n=1 Tax=Ictalurus punctatus TaxID=7998 RepID=A0A2D0Q4S0_ICTPU|nr:5-hydroxytryptamine receptor 3A [Ictalurus punctatus]